MFLPIPLAGAHLHHTGSQTKGVGVDPQKFIQTAHRSTAYQKIFYPICGIYCASLIGCAPEVFPNPRLSDPAFWVESTLSLKRPHKPGLDGNDIALLYILNHNKTTISYKPEAALELGQPSSNSFPLLARWHSRDAVVFTSSISSGTVP